MPSKTQLSGPTHSSNSSSNSKNDDSKFQKRIRKIKLACRSGLGVELWNQRGYASLNFNPPYFHKDKILRIDYHQVSENEFRARFEDKNIPVVITNGMHEWNASKAWTIDNLCKTYKNEKFKIGEDDKGDTVFIGFKHFQQYLNSQQVTQDDSPLYIFDSSFASRLTNDSVKKKKPLNPSSSLPTCTLVNDYAIPKYFTEDFFRFSGEKKRPPYRWIVIGPQRSGSGIHVDPLGTSAWNALISGHKRWVLFPPNVSKQIVDQKGIGDSEAVTWFDKVYPKFHCASGRDKFGRTLAQQLGMVEVVQGPGEIMFVPGGWYHVVMNLDTTIAITQNFCSRSNIEYVWLKTRFARPKLSEKLHKAFAKRANAMRDDAWVFKEVLKKIDALTTVPALLTSSSGSSSSSSDSSCNSEQEFTITSGKRKRA